jgi:hypothetical protein
MTTIEVLFKKEIEDFDFTKGTISTMLDLCIRVETNEDATRIIERYKAVNEYAEQNLGYIFGYIKPESRRNKLYKLFTVTHPIFGESFGKER